MLHAPTAAQSSVTAQRSTFRQLAASPQSLLLLVASAIGAGLLIGDWIAALGVVVLAAAWMLLPRFGPPVLALALTFQWFQITIGLYYHGLTGRTVPAIQLSDYRPMVLVGLGCVVALTAGLLVGSRGIEGRRERDRARPTWAFSARQLVLLYLVATVVQGPLARFAWQYAFLTQPLLALGLVRLALLYLLFRRLTTPPAKVTMIVGLLSTEVILGFTGYFAGFREPLMLLALALLERLSFRRVRNWAVIAVVGVVAVGAGMLWLGIRDAYREELELEEFGLRRSARLEKLAELSSDWAEGGLRERWDDLDFFVERMWAIYYPALTLQRVPAVEEHTGGTFLWGAIRHVLMPRLVFRDKPPLLSDSYKVRRYAGVWVAGPEQGTSIAFGYPAESYIDFGLPLMFLPIAAWGLFLGWAYRFFSRLIRHRELAVGLVAVVFWQSLYLFERSWVRIIGLTLTQMIYLGAAVLLVDRFLLYIRRRRSSGLVPQVAAVPGTGPRPELQPVSLSEPLPDLGPPEST